MGEEGIQRVPLTSDGSETEPCDTALPEGLDDSYAPGGPPNWRFPAITPITPPVVGVSHRQFCESVKVMIAAENPSTPFQPLSLGTRVQGSAHIPL